MNTLKLFLLFICFCSLSSYSQERPLIGVWTLFFSDEKVATLDCRICPTLEFKEDHTSIFRKPNGQQNIMTWKINENNMLTFKTKDESEKRIEDLEIQMIFTKQENFTELRFNPKNQSTKTFVLRKQ